MKEHFDPDVLLAPAGVLPESGTVHGWDGILGFIAEQMKAFEDGSMWLEPTEYIDTDDCLVVPYRFGGRARHTGIDVDFDFVHVGTTRDGKTIRIDVYETLPQAVQAAGLRD